MTKPEKTETHFVQKDDVVIEGMLRYSHEAMATTFEILIVHDDAQYAQQAAAAAFSELDRLESELSRFIENSDISRINNLPANQPLLVGLDVFDCLKISAELYEETGGAFDITIGSLLACWRDDDGNNRTPTTEQLNLALEHTGTNLIKLNEVEHTVELLKSPVHVDLGGIGKGYAVDRMAELLREWSIDIALISGGYSSVLALDAPPGKEGWPLTLSNPNNRKVILARPLLQNRALSGSGLDKGSHIINPRTAQPVEGKLAAWSSAPDAARTDALSTAFMVMTTEQIEQFCKEHPEVMAMIIIQEEDEKEKILHFGTW